MDRKPADGPRVIELREVDPVAAELVVMDLMEDLYLARMEGRTLDVHSSGEDKD